LACEKKILLMQALANASEQLLLAATRLNANIGTAQKDGYQRMRLAVETAKDATDRARIALDRHAAEHGC
jgi:hydroxyethylthiazole kinase-like sugar kinase family protein